MSSAERAVLGQPDASAVLIPLCKRCGISITARDSEKWVGSAPGLFLSFFSWQVAHVWAVLAA